MPYPFTFTPSPVGSLIDNQRQTIVYLTARVADLKGENTALQSIANGYKDDAIDATKKADELRDQVNHQADTIKDLQAEGDRKNWAIDELKKDLTEWKEYCTWFNGTGWENGLLKEQVRNLEEELNAVRASNTIRGENIETLKKEVDQLQNDKDFYKNLYEMQTYYRARGY